MSGERKVPTLVIRQAVGGHETEVLDELNIPWRSGRPHIDCPYKSHGGKDDWRWDDKKATAYCTCSKRHSIFDVVAKVEGIDFEAAKIRVAEIIGRTDLIYVKDAKRKKYQAIDAASLLNAPADNRDDKLPLVYLAHRLNVSVELVPIPVTQIAGLKALGYYDAPPSGSKAKPALVGEYPCAVFGTVAADGKTHAHRIYLAADGRGKAALSETADGKPRDPKKSARAAKDDNTAGRAVLWGDPARALHVVVAEGIETGAAVAFALAPEIAAGEIAIAAAISAGGVEAFQAYPATRRVTIAADRDEGVKDNGRAGSRRGEQAARTFGLQNPNIAVAIALPGAPGEAIDWLDVHLRDSSDAVRTGLLDAAVPFEPTQEERAAAAERRDRKAELELVARDYPLPAMDSLRLSYQHTRTGRVKVHKLIVTREGSNWSPVSTPFGIVARLRYADQGNAYGLRCAIQDMSDKRRLIDIDRGALAKMAAAEIRTMLFGAGLRTEDDGDLLAVQVLKAADPESEIVVVRRAGWQELAECPDPAFVLPSGAVLGVPSDGAVELAAVARMPSAVAEAGSLEGWQAAVTAATSVQGCEHWTLGTIAAFAGPLVALTGLDTCGVNLSGLSSSGKSTAQRLATSAWSTPDIRKPGLFQSARATDNAVEALAQRASGTVLVLDELAHVGGRAAAKIIYTICGGVGKRRMTADASVRDGYSWSTFAVLSGECSLEEKIRADGGEWLAGMAVRIVDVDVTGVNRQVDPETLRTINEIERHYGHAGPAFIHALIANGLHLQGAALRERVLKAARKLAGGETADSALIRAAVPLALLAIAGEIAKAFGIIPTSVLVNGTVEWAWSRFVQSSDAAALDPETQAIDRLKTWVAERWGVTIKDVRAEDGVNNREALAWYDEKTVYLPKERLREATGSTLKEAQIGAALVLRDLLSAKPEEDRFTVKWVPRIGRVVAYALKREEFGRSALETEPPFKIYEGGRK
jgi:hypothetical protein